MRLTPKQLKAIHIVFSQHFLPKDEIWLFGSRVDNSKKGGDIDFYVETYYDEPMKAIEAQIAFLRDLKKRIGDQKIDMILNILKSNKQQRIYDEAKNTGVKLI